jgi:hypothetical protein
MNCKYCAHRRTCETSLHDDDYCADYRTSCPLPRIGSKEWGWESHFTISIYGVSRPTHRSTLTRYSVHEVWNDHAPTSHALVGAISSSSSICVNVEAYHARPFVDGFTNYNLFFFGQ